jgi:hypothetical protein
MYQQEWHINSSKIKAANVTSWFMSQLNLLSTQVATGVAELSYSM